MLTIPFKEKVLSVQPDSLRADGVSVLQVNLGYRCNLSCKHCHVSGGPTRTEVMDRATAESVLSALLDNPLETLDLTGGAPELNPNFRWLVVEARRAGRHVIVRTNLSVFFEPGLEDTPRFLREHGVEVVASLPYYLQDGVDRVRGSGTFAKCIAGLRRLNELGYGSGSAEPRLSLVYNPSGAFLAPTQAEMEEEYRRELSARHGISFSGLFTLTNMPIGRFRDFLVRTGGLEPYLGRLACAFNPDTLNAVMCRRFVSVGWDGMLYDCDFNQMLGLPVTAGCSRHIGSFDYAALSGRDLVVGDHCYGCTAGQGSTCVGAVA
jgi:radical SAM/Cys-rich protein